MGWIGDWGDFMRDLVFGFGWGGRRNCRLRGSLEGGHDGEINMQIAVGRSLCFPE